MQELQRLQEEQTGKKRTEKLEWMYTTPATGSSQNPNDLEDYLLGKKRVDKILTADENAKVRLYAPEFLLHFAIVLFTRSEPPTRTSLRSKMRIAHAILQQKYAKILCWQSSNKNRLLTNPYCRILFVSKRCRKI